MTKQNYCFFLIYNEKASKKINPPRFLFPKYLNPPRFLFLKHQNPPGFLGIIIEVDFSITYIGTMFPFEYSPIECTTTYRILLGFFCFFPPFFI